MGFCGCSLAASTVVAVVLGLVQSIYGLSWNILVIVLMTHKRGEQNLTDAVANSTEHTWDVLSKHITSEKAFSEHLLEVVIAALVLNGIWLLTTLALAVGNAEKCKEMLKPWIGSTIIVTITDIAATIFFIFKAVKEDDVDDIETAYFTNIFVFCAFMFARGGPVLWIINVSLCVFVAQRVSEIGRRKQMPFGAEFPINPYSLTPPYDAFETGSSTKTQKNAPSRPHTPPPDYEGPNGKKKAEEATTGRGRPLSGSSFLFDDRVELQHRTSCAAETVLHHAAYINRGLVLESEGWMGIPRPTLKTGQQ